MTVLQGRLLQPRSQNECNVTGEAMKADGTVNRAALPAVFNPDELYALEAALQVREE